MMLSEVLLGLEDRWIRGPVAFRGQLCGMKQCITRSDTSAAYGIQYLPTLALLDMENGPASTYHSEGP